MYALKQFTCTCTVNPDKQSVECLCHFLFLQLLLLNYTGSDNSEISNFAPVSFPLLLVLLGVFSPFSVCVRHIVPGAARSWGNLPSRCQADWRSGDHHSAVRNWLIRSEKCCDHSESGLKFLIKRFYAHTLAICSSFNQLSAAVT